MIVNDINLLTRENKNHIFRINWKRVCLFLVILIPSFLLFGTREVMANEVVNDSLGGVSFAEKSLISPDEAESYYGTDLTHTKTTDVGGLEITTQRPYAIIELSENLKEEGFEPEEYLHTVYNYVTNNIDIEFRYGQSKGALGALIDQSGTAFDQSALMIDLLREAGVDASFELGLLQLNAESFVKWTGVVSSETNLDDEIYSLKARTACLFLAGGGIPAIINGRSDENCNYGNETLNDVSLSHVRVKSLGAVWDPSFKYHKLYSASEIDSLANCNQLCGNNLIDVSIPSGSVGIDNSIGGARFVNGVNETGLKGQLNQYAVALEEDIYEIGRGSSRGDILGGRMSSDKFRFNASLTPQEYNFTSKIIINGELPDQYRTLIKFKFFNNVANATLDSFEVVNAYADEIYGQLIVYRYNYQNLNLGDAKTQPPLTGLPHKQSELSISNRTRYRKLALINSRTEYFPALVSVDHPYAAASTNNGSLGSYMDRDLFTLGGSVGKTRNDTFLFHVDNSILISFGKPKKSRESYIGEIVERRFGQNAQVSGLPGAGNPLSGHLRGAAWISNLTQFLNVSEAVTDNMIQHHMSFIAVPTPRQGSLHEFAERGVGFDIHSSLSVTSADVSETSELSAKHTITAFMSALESATLRSHFDTWLGGSAIEMLVLANQAGRRFYDVNSSNVNALLSSWPDLTDIQDGGVSINGTPRPNTVFPTPQGMVPGKYGYVDIDGNQPIGFASYLQSPGMNSLEAAIGNIQKDQIRRYFAGGTKEGIILGTPDIEISYPAGTAKWLSGPILSWSQNSDFISYIAGGRKGAGTPKIGSTLSIEDEISKANTLTEHTLDINLTSGTMSLTEPADLTTGNGEFPYSLSFQRSYRSDADPSTLLPFSANKPFFDPISQSQGLTTYEFEDFQGRLLTTGWRHNFDFQAKLSSDINQFMGEDSALDAISSITAIKALYELGLEQDQFKSRLISAFVLDWWLDQLAHNAIIVNRGHDSSIFVRLPSGNYNPPRGSLEKLTYSGPYPSEFISVRGPSYLYDVNTNINIENVDQSVLEFAATDDCDRYYDFFGNPSSQCLRKNIWKASRWAFANNINVDFTYDSYWDLGAEFAYQSGGAATPQELSRHYRTRLEKIENTLNRSLNYSYSDNSVAGNPNVYTLATITDDQNRRVTIKTRNYISRSARPLQNAIAGENAVELPNGNVVNYFYDQLNYGRTNILTQKNRSHSVYLYELSKSDSEFSYDGLKRLSKVFDRNDIETRYKYGSLFGGKHYYGKSIDSLDNTTTTYFDYLSRPVRMIEPSYEEVSP